MNNLSDGIALVGRYRIRHADTGEILAETRNRITNAALDIIGGFVLGTSELADALQYFALGTGTTIPTNTDTQLVSESVRGTSTAISGSTGQVVFSRFFIAADVTFHIQEVGVFAGASASSTADSGTLFSRALLEYDNSTTGYDLVFDYTLTIARG